MKFAKIVSEFSLLLLLLLLAVVFFAASSRAGGEVGKLSSKYACRVYSNDIMINIAYGLAYSFVY